MDRHNGHTLERMPEQRADRAAGSSRPAHAFRQLLNGQWAVCDGDLLCKLRLQQCGHGSFANAFNFSRRSLAYIDPASPCRPCSEPVHPVHPPEAAALERVTYHFRDGTFCDRPLG